MSAVTFNGKIYGVPNSGMQPALFFYNKDIFDQMKVGYPSPNWTMADLLSAAKKLTTKDHFGLVMHNPNSSDKPNLFWALCSWQSAPSVLVTPISRSE